MSVCNCCGQPWPQESCLRGIGLSNSGPFRCLGQGMLHADGALTRAASLLEALLIPVIYQVTS
eukprot:1266132-Alexandrium_andersonii.AAC.1